MSPKLTNPGPGELDDANINDTPEFSNIINVAEHCFPPFSPSQVQYVQSLDIDHLANDLTLSKLGIAASSPFPVTNSQLLAAVMRAEGDHSSADSALVFEGACPQTASMLGQNRSSMKTAFKAATLSLGPPSFPHTNTMQLFQHYCMSCHYNGSIAPQLPFTSIRALRNYTGTAQRTVGSVLSPPDYIMPPVGTPIVPTQDRNEMLNAVGGPVPQPQPPQDNN